MDDRDSFSKILNKHTFPIKKQCTNQHTDTGIRKILRSCRGTSSPSVLPSIVKRPGQNFMASMIAIEAKLFPSDSIKQPAVLH